MGVRKGEVKGDFNAREVMKWSFVEWVITGDANI